MDSANPFDIDAARKATNDALWQQMAALVAELGLNVSQKSTNSVHTTLKDIDRTYLYIVQNKVNNR